MSDETISPTDPLAALRAERQQPLWDDPDAVAEVVEELRRRPPLVTADGCAMLNEELGAVARGEALVLQAGECAERFSDSRPERVWARAIQINAAAVALSERNGLPVVRIGRLAGQYAKPRSSLTEILDDGSELPVYRGDAVNDPAPSMAARRPDPRRMLAAYDHAAVTLDTLRLHSLLPIMSGEVKQPGSPGPIYISHEALLLDFERALVRPDPIRRGNYCSSAHFLWIGDRTRQIEGPHVELAANITNPVGLKVGPTAAPEEVAQIVRRLTAHHPIGRLTLIVRLGVRAIRNQLPPLVRALGSHGKRVVWLCDPMHGNTHRTATGQKTRILDDILKEIEDFSNILFGLDRWVGGLHLEVTPDRVQECVTSVDDLTSGRPLSPYLSACDPRLNSDQLITVVTNFAAIPIGGRTSHDDSPDVQMPAVLNPSLARRNAR